MSTTGRPEGEYRSAQHEGIPVSATGRPEGETRSAQHAGSSVRTQHPPMELANGFSQKSCFPARAAAMLTSACQWSGVATVTASTSLRDTTSRKSVYP